MSAVWSDARIAEGFVDGVKLGISQWKDVQGRENNAGWVATGFVYFIGIGAPYVTHVKIGFTAKDPIARMANLQTGCPFKMTMLGYVFGSTGYEQELHRVLEDDRCEGEWFVFSDYVSTIVSGQLSAEAI